GAKPVGFLQGVPRGSAQDGVADPAGDGADDLDRFCAGFPGRPDPVAAGHVFVLGRDAADRAGSLRMSLRWYVIHAYSNFENQVKKSLEERVRRAGLEQYFGKILVPTEEVLEMRM